MKYTVFHLALGTLAVGLGPAAQEEKAPPTDQQFVMKASQGGMAEVALGKLATERGQSDLVKKFGQRMVDDHGKANQELAKLAQAKGLPVAKDVGKENQQTMGRLAKLSGAEFDREYINHMVKDHVEDVSLFEAQSKNGKDQDLKAWAGQALPTLQEHLKMAKDIQEKTKGGK